MLNSCSSKHVKSQSCIVLFDLLLQQLYGILGQPSYIGKSVSNDHLGSINDLCYIQNRVITNSVSVIKRLRCIMIGLTAHVMFHMNIVLENLWSGFLIRGVLNSLLIFIKELLILWEEAAQTTFNVLIRLHTRRLICAFVVHMWYKDSFSNDNILIYMIKYYGYMFICSSFYVSTASLI